MKILLTGHTGQLGHILARDLQSLGEIVSPTRAQMNLEDPNQIREFVRRIRPDLIINPAAYTAVDKAESEPALAARINAEAPAILAQEAQRLRIGLVHFSTDYVFDGTQNRPYTEDDQPDPANVYGQTKLDGERAIAEHCEAFWIFRTSWVYGTHGGNFLKTITRLAQERDSLSVVSDQFGAPTWTRTISSVVTELLSRARSAAACDADTAYKNMAATSGVYHLTATGDTSWHAYAQYIVAGLQALRLPLKLHADAIAAVTTAAYPTAAKRPANSRLQTAKLTHTFDVTLPSWETAVSQCLSELSTTFPPKPQDA